MCKKGGGDRKEKGGAKRMLGFPKQLFPFSTIYTGCWEKRKRREEGGSSREKKKRIYTGKETIKTGKGEEGL